MITCQVAGEALVLLPERAAFWPSRKALFVADFHLGKAASFRRAGIPLPSGTTTENVERLDRAVERSGAREVVFLGDFLHSADGRAPRTFERFAAWRDSRAGLELTIVRGNHDRKAGDPPAAWRVRCIDAGEALGPFVLNHEPGASGAGYALAGHIHPAVRLSGAGEKSVRLPCFWFGARYGVLPAFGAFTGTAEVLPRRGDQVFVIADHEVVKVA
ncbi:MAG: ligase-associated DNA damage response endonuclease PdeM [Betaproteobacteria bacterium]